jgi:hypothetical protein
MINPEDKSAWVEWGVDQEGQAIDRAAMRGLPIIVNPARARDRYAIDAAVLCDIKTRRTPFRRSLELYGIPPKHCVTLNVEDLERYPDRALILFDVHYEELGVHGQWIAFADDLERSHKGVHQYERRVNDTINKQSSYVLDLRGMKRIA